MLSLALLSACSVSVSLGDEPAASVSTNLDDFSFESLDVEYSLSRAEDGTSRATVVETYVAVFPEYDQNRGMRRIVPETYNEPASGADWPTHPTLVSITDEAGHPRASETESEDGWYSMTSRADDYVHGRQTYVFTYTLENVTSRTDVGVDEFYWDVNGNDWAQFFGRITARVTMDAELAAALNGDAACYVGYQGSTDLCEAMLDAGVATATATDLQPHQGLTIAVGFEQGTFTPFDGSYFASPWGWLQGIAGLGVLAALVGAISTRVRRLSDEPGRPTIIAEYTPPQGVDALESAMLLGLTTKAIPAEVLEQAVVGSLRIVEGPRKFWGGHKLIAELVDPSRADGDGLMLLQGLFPQGVPGEQFEFGRTDTRFSTAAQGILKAATSELDRRGLRRKVPAGSRAWPIIVAVLAAVAAWILGFVALENGVHFIVPLMVMGASIVVVIAVIALVSRKPLTAKGAEVRDHLAGLKIFIEWAEADRIRMLQSPVGAERMRVDVTDPRQMLKLYETLLPYAVVFGQEKQWAKELAVLYGVGNAPVWYAGTGGFDASSFSAGISNLSASSSSSSSTSGGSGGGGSSGGGGGGGGGGGV
ncbi:hypothetical protein GCM10009775_06670 [Microbacterium aoyamense]|uniref:DUF2207 domain-containing protein n=1 Tax=Microbacterium aoyamense TaxID=344166 RepID=A0ABP5ARP3_9MICO